jgi:hypothetical protein
MILAGLTVTTGCLFCHLRKRRQSMKVVCPATPLLVYESTVSIEFDGLDDESETIIDIEDYDGRASFETILSGGTPRTLTFDIDSIMPFLSRRKSGILDRRGRTTLRCDTTAYYETDLMPTATISPIERRVCLPKVNFKEHVISPLSPSFTRPIFGFNPKTITPPLGNPLWCRMPMVRQGIESPIRRKDFWTP